ncbi:MAG TPA: thioredoxin family protein, partial [Candidatus Didemnitutus sp.]|nr:thioredoxin family protein [Candidatus Didemnitutus sp.]
MRILLAGLALFTAVALRADPEYPKRGADIYDTQVDGTATIAAAVTRAKAEHKHVLLDLGANWCIWCHRLHDLFETNDSVG